MHDKNKDTKTAPKSKTPDAAKAPKKGGCGCGCSGMGGKSKAW